MGVNYTPDFVSYTGQGAFKYWCQTVLPLVYDDSLSYYELLNKVVHYLNNVISDVSATEQNVESLRTSFVELQNYVNQFFDNLDISGEVERKLDEMASDGSLDAIVRPIIESDISTIVPQQVENWLDENITSGTGVVDNSLSIFGAASDSGIVGTELNELSSESWNDFDLINTIRNNNTFDFTSDGIFTGRAQDLTTLYFIPMNSVSVGDSYRIYFECRLKAPATEERADVNNSCIKVCFVDSSNTIITGTEVFLSKFNGNWRVVDAVRTAPANAVGWRIAYVVNTTYSYEIKNIMVADGSNTQTYAPSRTAFDAYARRIDSTLSKEGIAADAKAVGDAINTLSSNFSDIDNYIDNHTLEYKQITGETNNLFNLTEIAQSIREPLRFDENEMAFYGNLNYFGRVQVSGVYYYQLVLARGTDLEVGKTYTIDFDIKAINSVDSDPEGADYCYLGIACRSSSYANLSGYKTFAHASSEYEHRKVTITVPANTDAILFGNRTTANYTKFTYYIKNIVVTEEGNNYGFYYSKLTAVDSIARRIDATLSKEGIAADAKAVGDAVSSLEPATYNEFDIDEADIPSFMTRDGNELTFTGGGSNAYLVLLNNPVVGQSYQISFENCKENTGEGTGIIRVEFRDSSNTVLSVIECTTSRDYTQRSYTRVIPENCTYIAIKGSYTSVTTTFHVRNICVRKNNTGSVIFTNEFVPAKSCVDYVARSDREYKGLYDGYILRLDTNPDPIPVEADSTTEGGTTHLNYGQFISQTWDTFLTDYPSVVTKETRWNSYPDSNDVVYPLYRYIFTPLRGYDKTIFLSAGCHGNEPEAYWSLYRFMRAIYDEGYKYPNLRNLRNHVRFIIVPSWNPWGMTNWKRLTELGVQPYSWFATPTQTIDGVEISRESVGEAMVMLDTFEEFKDEIVAWIDLHTDPYAGRTTDERGWTDPYGCYGFAGTNSKTHVDLYDLMIDFKQIFKNELNFDTTWHIVTTDANRNGSIPNYVQSLGIPSCVCEFSTFMNNFPYASGSAGLMKYAQEWFYNYIANVLR